jgi:hypothetical protein
MHCSSTRWQASAAVNRVDYATHVAAALYDVMVDQVPHGATGAYQIIGYNFALCRLCRHSNNAHEASLRACTYTNVFMCILECWGTGAAASITCQHLAVVRKFAVMVR